MPVSTRRRLLYEAVAVRQSGTVFTMSGYGGSEICPVKGTPHTMEAVRPHATARDINKLCFLCLDVGDLHGAIVDATPTNIRIHA